MLVDIGGYGFQSDEEVFKASLIGEAFDNRQMNVPPNKFLPNSNCKFHYFLVGDAAFPLKDYIMKPFHGQNLSRSQRIFENVFEILVAQWRVIWSRLQAHPVTVDQIVFAIIALHDFANKTQRNNAEDCI